MSETFLFSINEISSQGENGINQRFKVPPLQKPDTPRLFSPESYSATHIKPQHIPIVFPRKLQSRPYKNPTHPDCFLQRATVPPLQKPDTSRLFFPESYNPDLIKTRQIPITNRKYRISINNSGYQNFGYIISKFLMSYTCIPSYLLTY